MFDDERRMDGKLEESSEGREGTEKHAKGDIMFNC